MITLPRNFFTPAQRETIVCTAAEGAFWAFGAFWLMHCSPLNPFPGRFVRLLDCYEELTAVPPPSPDVVAAIIDILRDDVPRDEREEYAIEALILRATAAEYYAN